MMLDSPTSMLGVLGFVALAASPSYASDAEPDPGCPEPSSDDNRNKEIAKQWFGEASGFIEVGKYSEAVGAYACSYRFVKHPNTLYNMGQAALTAGNDALALSSFQKYLAENPDGELADKSRLRITAIENRRERWRKRLEAEHEKREGPTADPALGEQNRALKKALHSARKRQRIMRLMGLGSAIAGGTCLAMGIGFQVASVKREQAAIADGRTAYSDHRLQQARGFQIAATSLFVSSGLTAVVGVSLLILTGKESRGPVAWRLAPGGGYLLGHF
jgi:tetratricopeptide (TPR) repeat protein